MNARRIAGALIASALLTILFVWWWDDAPLARVAQAEGPLERDRRGAEEKWLAAQLGDELGLGDALRTGVKSRARLAMSEGTVLDVAPETVVRLLSSAPDGERFRVVSGSAQIQAGDAPVTFLTPQGPVRLEKGTKISVREEDGRTWVRVDMGRAELGWEERKDTLAAGQERSASLAGASPAAPQAEASPEPDLPRAKAAAPDLPAPATPVKPGPAASPAAKSADVQPSAGGVQAVVRGNQVRVQQRGEKSARGIAQGEHVLPVGSLVTLDGDSSLELSQGDGAALVASGKGSLVVGDGQKVATKVLSGKVRATANGVPLEIEVPGGRILLTADGGGSAGSVEVGKSGTRVSSERGDLLLKGQGGEERLGAGTQGVLSARGVAEVSYRPPSARDMTLTAGTTTTVHDPKPPTAIAVDADASACAGGALVLEQQVGRGFQARAEGQGPLLVWFEPGLTIYRVRCLSGDASQGKVVANGRVTVERDTAARRVTRRAPELEVDLDGRKYTAVYQTLLPRVRLRLPNVLGKTDASARIQGPGAAKEVRVPSSGLALESGAFGEGTYQVTLLNAGSAAPKKPTTIVVQFDNAAPAAYLEGTEALKPAADGSVVLRGAALEDSQLSLDGTPVTLDRAARFQARVVPNATARGVGLWIRHPRLGSHHYVRRIQGRGEP